MKISFIGGGNMAAALIGGMLKRGYSAAAIQVVELVPAARERLTEQFGVRCAAVADDSVLACDVLVRTKLARRRMRRWPTCTSPDGDCWPNGSVRPHRDRGRESGP